jgi:selenobiotic family peptide radical SAM maturase
MNAPHPVGEAVDEPARFALNTSLAMTSSRKPFDRGFPACRAVVGEPLASRLEAAWLEAESPDFPTFLAERPEAGPESPLPDLARLEQILEQVAGRADGIPGAVEELTVNPSAEVFRSRWTGLADLLRNPDLDAVQPGEEMLLVWRDPLREATRVEIADDGLLLALKMAVEGLSPRTAAREAGADPAGPVAAVNRAAAQGLVLKPPSRIRREPDFAPEARPGTEPYASARVFTLQWHVTQACDLSCRHCYDRSSRPPVSLERGMEVLGQVDAFVESRRVEGQVTFSGGNPLLHPHCLEFYREAARLGLRTALLGNPCSRERLEELVAIQRPAFFQVSLEGLEAHNDDVRGDGHFRRTLDFLDLLSEAGVFSMVMLTLTRANQDQVLPLAETLRGRTNRFTFNRLSAVGEGAHLAQAPVEGYERFLNEYLDAAAGNPCMSLKDSLLNPAREQRGEPVFGGCAGHGCGAAFNFLALLPDGEVHACRKFPSLVGDLREQDLASIYDSPEARRHRLGSQACRECGLKPVCGGCQAVAHAWGLDPLRDRDPFCFCG